jgi:hypothetical protein
VLLLRDEMANLAWAVEQCYEGGAGHPVERAEQDRHPPAPEPPRTTGLRLPLGRSVPPHRYPMVPSAGRGRCDPDPC